MQLRPLTSNAKQPSTAFVDPRDIGPKYLKYTKVDRLDKCRNGISLKLY